MRRVFASTSSVPAYNYDPYGVPLQVTAPVTDLNYAGMFCNADSGRYLTLFHAYDPIAGRWLSRDPSGERGDPVGNVYPYVGGDPISLIDPLGLCGDFWNNLRNRMGGNPWLLPLIIGTEVAGGGPEDPLADAAVAAEIAAVARR